MSPSGPGESTTSCRHRGLGRAQQDVAIGAWGEHNGMSPSGPQESTTGCRPGESTTSCRPRGLGRVSTTSCRHRGHRRASTTQWRNRGRRRAQPDAAIAAEGEHNAMAQSGSKGRESPMGGPDDFDGNRNGGKPLKMLIVVDERDD
jgi:hypothetical protein